MPYASNTWMCAETKYIKKKSKINYLRTKFKNYKSIEWKDNTLSVLSRNSPEQKKK